MERLERVQNFEKILENQEEILKNLKDSFEKWQNSRKEFKNLMDYTYTDEWISDMENAENEKLKNVKRSVLAEDTIYDLYTEQRELAFKMIRESLNFLEK